MKKISKILCGIFCTMLTTTYAANATPVKEHNNYFPDISLGVNALVNTMKFKEGYGDNLFAKHAGGVNVFAQAFPHKNFGLELGFEGYANRSRVAFVGTGARLANVFTVQNGNFFVVSSKIKQWYVPLTVVGKINIKDNYFIALGPGISLSGLKASFKYLGDQGGHVNGGTDNFSKTKVIPILKMMFGYKFNNIGIQALASWKNTSKFKKIVSPDFYYVNNAAIYPKNSFNYGIGIEYFL